ncbi:hypothetical protein G4B88_030275 [Cannabis sativa]|uniref:Glutaminyl-tRNA synthetase class Ib non-specific RNA-binding domain-containing protein n=1 Tax=Cannabis sativa TaxID=3483 RepID=A0A7J6GEU5_CANSA|nr:hypothetical protein G4B88_030275 [Cannabis sativa]
MVTVRAANEAAIQYFYGICFSVVSRSEECQELCFSWRSGESSFDAWGFHLFVFWTGEMRVMALFLLSQSSKFLISSRVQLLGVVRLSFCGCSGMPLATKDSFSSDKEEILDLFLRIQLDERTAKNTLANAKVTSSLLTVIHEADVTEGCDRAIGNFLYTIEEQKTKVSTKYPANALVHRPTFLKYVVSSKIKTPAQLEAAFPFLTNIGSEDFKLEDFEEHVEVSAEEIERTVNEVFEESKSVILEQRYRTNVGDLFANVRKRQPWADPKIVKKLIDAKLYELLGERTAADDEKIPKKKKEKNPKAEEKKIIVSTPELYEEDINPFLIFPQPEDNFKDREALLESHKDGYRIESQQRKDGLVAKSRLMTADDRGMGGYDDEMGYDPNPKPKMHMKGGKIGEDCEAVECEDYLSKHSISKNKRHQDRAAALEVWDRLEEFVRINNKFYFSQKTTKAKFIEKVKPLVAFWALGCCISCWASGCISAELPSTSTIQSRDSTSNARAGMISSSDSY